MSGTVVGRDRHDMIRETRPRPSLSVGLALASALVASQAIAGSGQRQLACSRGQLDICADILAQPRLAPGVRAAIEHLLADIAADSAACDARDTTACTRLLERLPDLPNSVRESLSAAQAVSLGR
jgi:hypothetical protein